MKHKEIVRNQNDEIIALEDKIVEIEKEKQWLEVEIQDLKKKFSSRGYADIFRPRNESENNLDSPGKSMVLNAEGYGTNFTL